MAQCPRCNQPIEYRFNRIKGKAIAYDTSTDPWTEHKCSGRAVPGARRRANAIRKNLNTGFEKAIDKED